MNEFRMSIVLNNQTFTNATTKLYLSRKAADVHFVFKSGERIPAHKNLLIAASEVFNTMFYGSMPEKGDVKIVDVSADAFKEFLQFFYLNKVQLTRENIGDVMDLGNRYNVPGCLELCEQFTERILTIDNICQIYGLSIIYDRKRLKYLCEGEIAFNSTMVFESAGFLECNRTMLGLILKIDRMRCTESVVFKACMLWTKAVSKQENLTRETVEEHLGELFYQIRFRSMTTDEFSDLLSTYADIFSLEMREEITQIMKTGKCKTNLFNRNRRRWFFEWNENAVVTCSRFWYNSLQAHSIGNVSITKFTINKALLLGAFRTAYIHKDNDQLAFNEDVSAEVTISTAANQTEDETSSRCILLKDKVQLDKFRRPTIFLSKPILIHSGVEYEIRLDIESSVWIYLQLERYDEKVKLESEIIVQFHRGSTSKNDGKDIIHELDFNLIA